MPRKVLPALLQDICRDVQQHYKAGDRYRSVRELAAHFKVSLQTAQKAVTTLVKEGWLIAEAKRGLRVCPPPKNWQKVPPRVVLLTNNPDPRFNQAVLTGLKSVLIPAGIEPKLVLNTQPETNSLGFGEWIVSLKADGIVAMSFRQAALPFYYAQTHGVNIVSGIIYDELPTLPAVQHNNTLHAEEAAREFHRLGKRRILCAGYWEPANRRFQAFRETVLKLNPRAEIVHAWLAKPESVARMHLFFMHFRPETDGVFSLEYSANYALAPYFVSHRISPDNTFFVFNNEQEHFHYPGLPPVRAAAPSLQVTGQRLAAKLLARLQTGKWTEPKSESI